MNNPLIQTDLSDVLTRIDTRLERMEDRLNKLEIGQAEIKGEIKTLDEKLSGRIESVDNKLSGQIKTLDEKVSGQKEVSDKLIVQLDKRINNQELLNRVIGGSLVVSIIGGIISFFWMASKIT